MYKIKLIKSFRRTISISIEQDGSLTVRAPRGIANHHIDDFLKEKSSWIEKHISKAKEKDEKARALTSKIDSKKILYYKKKIRKILEERTQYFASKYNLRFQKIRLSSARKRWGSCSSSNSLNFNWRIIFAPKEVLDYLVIHELAHTRHKNHQKQFWNLVEEMDPLYKQNRKWLKNNSYILDSL
jgi:predicted metal-dependent hydrolase